MNNDTLTFTELTIGIDLGNKEHELCILNRTGEIIKRDQVPNNIITVKQYFEKIDNPTDVKIAMEAGTCSPWVSDLLKKIGFKVIVANPRKLRMIWNSKNKNDERDAEMIARVARLDPNLLYGIQHRSMNAQQMLTVIKVRDHFVRCRTKTINSLRGILKSLGITELPKCDADNFSEKILTYITEELYPVLSEMVYECADLTNRIETMDDKIKHMSENECIEAKHLQQIQGVGPITALTFVLAIDDPKRFAKSRDIGAYLGLTPARDQSGDSDKQLRITKQGNKYLRSLLVGCAQYILSSRCADCDLKRYGERISSRGGRIGKKKAVVAIARKLAILMHQLWVSGEDYEPLHKKMRIKARA